MKYLQFNICFQPFIKHLNSFPFQNDFLYLSLKHKMFLQFITIFLLSAIMFQRGDRERINAILSKQQENIAQMQLFNDEDQEQTLNSRSNVIKANYKYINKIEKAEQCMKVAKEVNLKMLENNKKALQRLKQPKKSSLKNTEKGKISLNESVNQAAPVQQSSMIRRSKAGTEFSQFNHKQTLQISEIKEQNEQIQQKKRQRVPQQLKSQAINKSILNVDYKIVQNYFRQKLKKITAQSTPQQIYKILSPFYQLCGIKINLPLIKKYKNCTYFGQSKQENVEKKKYQGFLLFNLDEKLYYGQLENEKKHGNGIEIDFKSDLVFIGNFEKGRKNGQFTVFKPHQTYKGQLKKGEYHGYGELTTQISVYRGFFQNNMRHGKGEEQFNSGLTIEGIFCKNKYTNISEKTEFSRINTIKTNSSKNQKILVPLRAYNPQKQKQRSIVQDDTVRFEATPYNKNYQEFNCQFGVDQSEDEHQVVSTRKANTFRIKQKQKVTPSHNKRSLSYDQADAFSFKK